MNTEEDDTILSQARQYGDEMHIDLWYPRNARPPSKESPHYPLFLALREGREVLRDDKLNDVKEVLTLDHPGIQGNAANIAFYGYTNLSLANAHVDLPDTAAQDSASKSNNPAVSG